MRPFVLLVFLAAIAEVTVSDILLFKFPSYP